MERAHDRNPHNVFFLQQRKLIINAYHVFSFLRTITRNCIKYNYFSSVNVMHRKHIKKEITTKKNKFDELVMMPREMQSNIINLMF